MTEKNDVLPSAEKETLDYMRDIANSLGYESVLEALEALDRLKSRPTASADIVERVARALRKHEWSGTPVEDEEFDREYWLGAARAALSASPVQELVEVLANGSEALSEALELLEDLDECPAPLKWCNALDGMNVTLAKVRDQ